MPGRIHRSAQHIRNRTARVAACSRSPENRSNIRIVRHPSQLKSIIGIDRKNHIVKIVIEVLNHPKLHRIRLQIMLFFVLLHVGPVSHITSEVTPLAAGPGNEKNRDRARRRGYICRDCHCKTSKALHSRKIPAP